MAEKKRLQIKFVRPDIEGPEPVVFYDKESAGGSQDIFDPNVWDFNKDGDISQTDASVFSASVPLWLEYQAAQAHAAKVGFSEADGADPTKKAGQVFSTFNLKNLYAQGKELYYPFESTLDWNMHSHIHMQDGSTKAFSDFPYANQKAAFEVVSKLANRQTKEIFVKQSRDIKFLSNFYKTDGKNEIEIYPVNSLESNFHKVYQVKLPQQGYTPFGRAISHPVGGVQPLPGALKLKANTKANVRYNGEVILNIMLNCCVFDIYEKGHQHEGKIRDFKFLDNEFFKNTQTRNFFPIIEDDFIKNDIRSPESGWQFSLALTYLQSYLGGFSYKGKTGLTFWDMLQEDPINHGKSLDPINDGLAKVRFKGGTDNFDKLFRVQSFYEILEKQNLVVDLAIPSQYDVIKQLAIAKYNSSYVAASRGSSDMAVAVDTDGNAMHFSRVDLEYFQANTEKTLIPGFRNQFIDLCFFISDNAPARNPFSQPPNEPVVIPEGIVPATINWNSKEACDLFHAALTQKFDYVKFQYGIDLQDKKYEDIKDSLMVDGKLMLGGEPREYSDRKIIEPPVWKVTRCNPEYYVDDGRVVFYVEYHPFYDYSLTGLFNLSHLGEGSVVSEKDQDFSQ